MFKNAIPANAETCPVVGYGLQIRSTWDRWDVLDQEGLESRGDPKRHAKVQAEDRLLDVERDALYTLVCLTEAKSLTGVQVQVAVQAVLADLLAGGCYDPERVRSELVNVGVLIARTLAKLTGTEPFELLNEPVFQAA